MCHDVFCKEDEKSAEAINVNLQKAKELSTLGKTRSIVTG